LLERSGINLHNAVLHKSLCSHKFIASSIVHNINDSSLACNTYSKNPNNSVKTLLK